jgi:23S rRNA pseudouridine2605 synthase
VTRGGDRAERIQKLISRSGLASRRRAEEWIRQGRVTVDGQTAHLGQKADPDLQTIMIDGRPLFFEEERLTVILNKPPQVVSTLSDPQGRPTVADLTADLKVRLFPVGRLDYHSQGLLLMTNDGPLAQQLAHPAFKVPKTYLVKVKGRPRTADLDSLRTGIKVEGRRTAPAQVEVVGPTENNTWLRITVIEGRNRLIRKMCAAIGHGVKKLIRERIGPLELGDLAPGKHRRLTRREIEDLRRAGRAASPGPGAPSAS